MLSIKDSTEQNMEFIYMILEDHERYYLKDTSSKSMDALYWFLMFEPYMMHRINSVKEWASSNPNGGIHTEFGSAYLRNNNIIVSSDFVDATKKDVEIIIKKDTFIKLLDDWKEIYLKLPKEVTIYFDGMQFTFDPVY